MKKVIFLAILTVALFAGACNRGDFKATPIIEGQAAPHAGFNFGPDSYLQEGQAAKVTGLVIYIKGIDPNEIFD